MILLLLLLFLFFVISYNDDDGNVHVISLFLSVWSLFHLKCKIFSSLTRLNSDRTSFVD